MTRKLPGSDAGAEEITLRLQRIESGLATLTSSVDALRAKTAPIPRAVTLYALTMTGQALRREMGEAEVRDLLARDIETLHPAFLACWTYYRRVMRDAETEALHE